MESDFNINCIYVVLTPKINLAFYQNAVPVLRELVIINEGKETLQEVELSLQSEPAFIKSKIWRADAIKAGQHFRITDLDVSLDGALLGRLTEAESARVTFVLNVGEKEFGRLDKMIELLPRNQWGGIGHMPEIIAAFVQPNEPAIDHLLKKTAEILRNHGKNSALTGYEGGPKRVWELSSAIWAAFGSIGLDYSLPPASFERAGQKIRSSGQIIDARIATCMDTTLFFCAVFEQCGLNPLIIFTQNHVFAGVWLKAEEFTTVVVDDITALRKREKLNELLLFETTLVTQRPCPSFKRAVELGAQHISEDEEGQFELAIDIRRARLQRIKPLASEHVVEPSGQKISPKEDLEAVFEEAPDFPDYEIVQQAQTTPSEPQDRLDRWQRKLLDLSLRNSLLNFRTTKRAIKLFAPDPGRIEDMLSDGHVLKLLPHPDLMNGTDPRSQKIYEARTSEDVRRAHAVDALNRKEIMVSLPKDELDSRLVELYRFARANLQEGGANTLFLALGFLSWTRDEKDNKRFRAPLVLIPVTLQRSSVRSGFTLRIHDDEPRFNPTLIEMLRQDFHLELQVRQGELPRDDHGLDITGIWNAVAQAIKDIRGWEVVEEVVLSTYSFAKYLMWKDLIDRTDQLKQNPVVKHLIDTPRETYQSSGCTFLDPRALDQTYGPEQIFCPLSADSSQLSAVIAAANGKDFVLIGPPGTGKSQTIANIIAHCLAEKKSILFVSEKIAALNVVYRRLCEIKLGDFCLQLHSNKARKVDVLQQLDCAWEAKGEIDDEEWKRETQRLKTIRDQLNKFVRQLHCKRRNGLTAYTAIGLITAGRDLPKLGLSWPSADVHSAEDLVALRDLADKLDINAKEVGAIANSPLAYIPLGEWSPSWQQALIDSACDLISAADHLDKSAQILFEAIGIPKFSLDERRREVLSILSRTLPNAAGRDWRFVLRHDVRTISEELRNGLSLLEQCRDIKSHLHTPWSVDLIQKIKHGLDIIERHREVSSQLSTTYNSNVSNIDVGQLKIDWEKANKSWWPLNWLRRRQVRSALVEVVEGDHDIELPSDIDRLVILRKLDSEINILADSTTITSNLWAGLDTRVDDMSAALTFQTTMHLVLADQSWNEGGIAAVAAGRCGAYMAADLERLRSLRFLQNEIAKLDHLHSKTNGLWNGLNTRTEELERALDFQEKLTISISKIATSSESFSKIKTTLQHLLGEGNALLDPTGPIANAGSRYSEAVERFHSAYNNFSVKSGMIASEINIKEDETPESIKNICSGIVQLQPKLRAWCAWRKVRGEAITKGLMPLVNAIEKGKVEHGVIRKSFEIDYARWWLNVTVDNDEVLLNFVSAEHDKCIADFRALDDRLTELTRDYVRAGLCAALPGKQESRRNSEWGILRHEMQKKKQHMPLRELINCIPSAITKLAPCLLMSPLSIAQYLSTETPLFDIVVFDEASQIPVWDAIGAIARGKQVVMVGDPKQLPPTSFFDRAESEADYEDVEGDLESILDECLGANLPMLNLSWHYRSRHESLITFSNSRYYGGGLLTFPSPNTEDKAVSLHIVEDGVYEKGGARINKPEARALVTHIVSRLKDQEFVDRGLSIGIVTFNAEQQRLIEDLLDFERRKLPSIESFFADDRIEPIFVKNLESVQGDERDIMYFSLTYGPDITKAISMNFGPMNQDGGERRLNVAITRARHELLVFSSLRPEQIDLSRTSAVGVRDLKHFMEFADRGPKAIAEAVYGTIGDYDSQFERMVAEALANKGWYVHPQVGVSSFRIDIGVVDPDMPGQYLAGIECDGATYHRSATARDRDKLREHVLHGLGWHIVRIWSTDWWIDASGALEKVHSSLERLLEESRAKRAEEECKRQEVLTTTKMINSQDFEGNRPADADLFLPADVITPRGSYQKQIVLHTESESNIAESSLISEHAITNHSSVTLPGSYVEAYHQQELFREHYSAIFAPYQSYIGHSFSDPRITSTGGIAEGLCRIIEVENPILTKRAYDIYLRGCGIKRMGLELKHTMDKAIQHAVRQNRLVVEDELNNKGFINAIVRITDTPPLVLRKRGPRSFEEIPPSEVMVASHLAMKNTTIQKGSDEHLHTILEMFDLKRLTYQTKTRLLEIIEKEFDYVVAWIRERGTDVL